MNSLFATENGQRTTAGPDREAKFRKALPKLPPIRRFSDLRAPSISGDDKGANAISPGLPTAGNVLLAIDVPCRLLGVICDQWDLFSFVVPETSPARQQLPAARFCLMPEVIQFLRAQARRICPSTGEIAGREKRSGATLCVELSPARWYSLLYFCCATHGNTLDPVRDAIEPVIWKYEAACESAKVEDRGSKMEGGQ